jgi:thiol-disulfide isomerase/thioredoxin
MSALRIFSVLCVFLAHGAFAKGALQEGLSAPLPVPEIAGITTWVNSKPLTIAGLKGKVVLVDFWAYSCINCVRTLPYLAEWDRKYRDKGLVIIGIHAPEFDFEKNPGNVRKAVEKYGIHYPVALDNAMVTWAHFNNRYWPAHYLIDKSGAIVYTHFGEGKYDVTEDNIRVLLGLPDEAEDKAAPVAGSVDQTPETYLGYERAEAFTGSPLPAQNTLQKYQPAGTLRLHHWTLGGAWRMEAQRVVAQESGTVLRLHFKARKVFAVLGSDKPTEVSVMLNGKSAGMLQVKDHALYPLADQQEGKEGVLEIKSKASGLEIYTFTFGD